MASSRPFPLPLRAKKDKFDKFDFNDLSSKLKAHKDKPSVSASLRFWAFEDKGAVKLKAILVDEQLGKNITKLDVSGNNLTEIGARSVLAIVNACPNLVEVTNDANTRSAEIVFEKEIEPILQKRRDSIVNLAKGIQDAANRIVEIAQEAEKQVIRPVEIKAQEEVKQETKQEQESPCNAVEQAFAASVAQDEASRAVQFIAELMQQSNPQKLTIVTEAAPVPSPQNAPQAPAHKAMEEKVEVPALEVAKTQPIAAALPSAEPEAPVPAVSPKAQQALGGSTASMARRAPGIIGKGLKVETLDHGVLALSDDESNSRSNPTSPRSANATKLEHGVLAYDDALVSPRSANATKLEHGVLVYDDDAVVVSPRSARSR